MKRQRHILKHFFSFLTLLFFAAFLLPVKANAAEYQANISANRSTGECTYSVQGLDPAQIHELTLQVSHKDTKAAALQSNISLTQDNCAGGTYTGTFSLESLNNTYDTYTVNILIGDTVISAGTCDFSVHTDKLSMNISGGTGDASRNVQIISTESSGDVVIPGQNKSVSVMA